MGRFARKIDEGTPKKIEIILHGPFTQTNKGHGTVLAWLGGLLGMDTDDVRIKDSYRLAEEAGMKFSFSTADLGEDYHVNTAKFIMLDEFGYRKSVVGCSLGGGQVLITALYAFTVEIEGRYPTRW